MTEAAQNGSEASTAVVVADPSKAGAASTAIVPVGDVRTAGFDLTAISIVDKTASFVAKHGEGCMIWPCYNARSAS
jgi:hypothetical protein